MIRAVIDTNVFVSAMISSAGNEALIVLAIDHGWVVPYFSEEIFDEYYEVLLRPRFGFPPDQVNALLDLLRRSGVRLDAVPVARVSPDPDDDKFISCALAAKVDFLVTGNKRHFPDSGLAAIRVLNAAEVLQVITLEL